MVKRGMSVWIFSSLTFFAAIHAVDSILTLFFNNEIVLLKFYPILNTLNISAFLYFLASTVLTIGLWGITCKIALETPVEKFLDTVLADAKKQAEVECEMVEDNRGVLDMICETITDNSKLLGQTRDLTYNVRSELVNLRPLPEGAMKLSTEHEQLRNDLRNLIENFKNPSQCPSCGSLVLQRYKLCPYCGETLQLEPEKVIVETCT